MQMQCKWLLLLPALLMVACASQPELGGDEPGFSIVELEQRAEMASYAGAHSDALLQYQKILEKEPDNIAALVGVGESLLAVNQPRRAESYFERTLKIDPVNTNAREARALSWLMQGKSIVAKKSLDDLVDDGVERWRVWNGLGVIADLSGDYMMAVEYYQKAIALAPNLTILHNNLGYSQIMAHDYVAAEASLKKALLLGPGNARVLNNLALCTAWQGRYDEATNILSPVIGAAAANNNTGYIAYLRKEHLLAKEFFARAMRLSPTYYKKAANNLEMVNRKLALVE
ncbi:MAG: tetratricopeptide repeat protein [Pseudomonadota bacterium]